MNVILLKSSVEAGKAPSVADIQKAEAAVNHEDKKLFFRHPATDEIWHLAATGISPSAIAGTAVTTTDPRLSDARQPLTHSHPVADVTGLQSALDGKIGKNSSDASPVSTIRCLTQAEYDALGSYDSQTLYFIK